MKNCVEFFFKLFSPITKKKCVQTSFCVEFSRAFSFLVQFGVIFKALFINYKQNHYCLVTAMGVMMLE